MKISRVRRNFAAVVATAAVGMGLAAGAAAPQADAQQGNMALFGDSLIANPNSFEYLGARVGLHPNGTSDPARWCPTDPNSFGKQAARRLDLEPHDYSCAGTVSISQGPQFANQVDRALAEDGLNAETKRVVIISGFNDTYRNMDKDPQQVRREYVEAMSPQVDRIRGAAPNARIQIVGYPTITSGDRVCLFHIGPNVYDATPMPAVRDWENLAQWMGVDLAEATGAEFLDVKPATANNGMCARDDSRMFAGLVDFYAGPGNLPVHVNARGHDYLGGIVADS